MHTEDARAVDEIRELHARWFDASHRKDLDATMEPIAADIVSFEHSPPLRYTEVAAIREECRAGFEHQGEGFTWTVPDLEVAVRGDLAVAWGLNRMASRRPDGSEEVTWSRGTRVFRRIDDEWRMVHQHVSFPVDPTTGVAATDLTP